MKGDIAMSTTHRTFKVQSPEGEIAVVQRPGNLAKVVFYPKGGEHLELLLEKQDAFDLAMEILQHIYRLG
jgi:hypothetical protein